MGYYGINCSDVCSTSYYGIGCTTKCECSPCHHIYGCLLITRVQQTVQRINTMKMEPTSMPIYWWSLVIFKNIDFLLLIKTYHNILSFKYLLNLSNNKKYESERNRIGIQKTKSDKIKNSIDFKTQRELEVQLNK